MPYLSMWFCTVGRARTQNCAGLPENREARYGEEDDRTLLVMLIFFNK
jgi:hypothetical protein